MSFGSFIKFQRKSLGLTLREFCRKTGYDPSYISRIENNLTTPPVDQNKLSNLGLALGLKKETREWITLFDLASAAKYGLPEDIKNNFPEVSLFLPAFFRVIRKKNISHSDITNLTKLLKETKDNKN